MNRINKISLLIVCILYFSVKLAGQPLVGFQLGINVASFSGDKDNDETRLRVGVSPYLSFDFPVNHMLTVETGISYSMQGMQRTRTIKNGLAVQTIKTNFNVDYLLVPVYLKENFTNFYAKIGPYGAYLANAVEKWETTENKSGVITETSGTNQAFLSSINPYDVGISIGFGYIHYFQKNQRRRRKSFGHRRTSRVMQVDLKYNLGLVPLDATGNNPDLSYKNRVFTIGLSINSIID